MHHQACRNRPQLTNTYCKQTDASSWCQKPGAKKNKIEPAILHIETSSSITSDKNKLDLPEFYCTEQSNDPPPSPLSIIIIGINMDNKAPVSNPATDTIKKPKHRPPHSDPPTPARITERRSENKKGKERERKGRNNSADDPINSSIRPGTLPGSASDASCATGAPCRCRPRPPPAASAGQTSSGAAG